MSINWEFGTDLDHVIKNTVVPKSKDPTDLTTTDQESTWEVRIWNQTVFWYGQRKNDLTEKLQALFSLVHGKSFKLMKDNLKVKQRNVKVEEDKNAIWRLQTLEDAVSNFYETKPNFMSIDDQIENIWVSDKKKCRMKILSKMCRMNWKCIASAVEMFCRETQKKSSY